VLGFDQALRRVYPCNVSFDDGKVVAVPVCEALNHVLASFRRAIWEPRGTASGVGS
jgi:hypothetical protein